MIASTSSSRGSHSTASSRISSTTPTARHAARKTTIRRSWRRPRCAGSTGRTPRCSGRTGRSTSSITARCATLARAIPARSSAARPTSATRRTRAAGITARSFRSGRPASSGGSAGTRRRVGKATTRKTRTRETRTRETRTTRTSSRAAGRWPEPPPGFLRSGRGGRALDVARARRPLAILRGRLAAGVRVGLPDRLHVGTEDGLAVAARPLVRVARTVGGALEARHHVAREQLVRVQRLLAVGPVMGAEEQAAEAAVAQFPQLLDALDDRLHGADERRAHLHALGQRVVGAAGRPAERLLEVRDRLVALGALDLAHRFLVVLGHMDVDDELPVLAVHRLAVLGRGLLADLPLVGQRLGPAGHAGAEREHAEPVPAGGDHAGGRPP